MYLKKTYLLLIIFFVTINAYCQTNTKSETHKILTASNKFEITFIDTSLVKTITVEAQYKTGEGYFFKLDNNSSYDSLGNNLNYYIFEFEFSKAFEKKYTLKKAISQVSLQEVWHLLYGLNNPNSAGTEAGTLQLSNKIIVIDNNSIDADDYNKRRAIRKQYINGKEASLVAQLQYEREKLLEAVKSASLTNKYDTIKIKDGDYTHANKSPEKSDIEKYPIAETLFASCIKTQNVYASFIDSCALKSIYKIKNIEIQFERGFLEKIKVWVNYKDGCYIFENIYAIGFSSVYNYKSLSKMKLHIRSNEFENETYIYLSDVIRNYDNRLANFTRDYSPEDTTINVDPNTTYDVVLGRNSYTNIIDSKVFTDLNGTKKSNPNGLFQIELSKRFNLNTARRQFAGLRADYGIANYVNLFGAVNKIEQNNRKLTLHNANQIKDGIVISPNYASNLDYTRYENYSAGCFINVALLDLPDAKTTFYFDLGLKYAYLNIEDSVITPKGLKKNPYYFPEAHTVTISLPKVGIELFSESRISICAAYYHNITLLFSNNASKQVASYQKSDVTTTLIDKGARRSNVFELSAKLMPNKDRNSHIFLRFRFYTQYGDANTSFSQIQLGYAYNWSINK